MENIVLLPLGLDLCVLRFPVTTKLTPEFINAPGFLNITRTDEELSVVCEMSAMPENTPEKKQDDWKAFKVKGPLDFSLTGILSAVANRLAEDKVSIFAVSTYDTDYVLVKADDFERAKLSLAKNFRLE